MENLKKLQRPQVVGFLQQDLKCYRADMELVATPSSCRVPATKRLKKYKNETIHQLQRPQVVGLMQHYRSNMEQLSISCNALKLSG